MASTKDIFLQKKIVKNADGKALDLYDSVCPDFTVYKNQLPSSVINSIWNSYQALQGRSNNLNGKVFEYILASILLNEGITPFYAQAKVTFIPNADYDLLVYSEEKGPIVLSAKTSLRERYKQADLEAVALKYVHRKAESYLITLDQTEAINIQTKVTDGEVIGINKVVYARSQDFDDLIACLKTLTIIEAGQVDIVKAGVVVR